MHSKSLFPFLAAALLAALPAFPQGSATGSLSGQVVDPEGLRLPGVVVTARSRELQGIRATTTSGNGDYIPFLPSGDYTVTFELNGFQTLTRSERGSRRSTPSRRNPSRGSTGTSVPASADR